MSNPGDEDKVKGGDHRQDDLAETKRIMERLVRTPPKPHKDKGDGKPTGKSGESPEKQKSKRERKKPGR